MTRATILLVGHGRMGSALYQCWSANSEFEITVLDPNAENAFKSPGQIIKKCFDIIVLAVKPQILDDVLASLVTSHITTSVILSIAAGKPLKTIENYFSHTAVIRAMPNTPALIGQGMTVAVANSYTNANQKQIAEKLLCTIGQFEWIEDENLMDAVTAVSGSGPAYLFLLIEELAKAGIAQGLAPGLAMTLARQTVTGSAALAAQSKDDAAVLRQNVTSPGGTTEAALKVLMAENGLGDLMGRAVAAAVKRGRVLS